MAKKKNTNGEAPEVIEQPLDETAGASNCTDETKRQYYRDALLAKIALESAQAAAKKKNAEYRNVLKDAKKAGVNTDAITAALADRFRDEDELVIDLRERLKMLDLGGIVPSVIDKILARMTIEEPTSNEAHQMKLDRAYDGGVFDGRGGAPRDANQFAPGTDLYDAYDRGWLIGQQAIADEMMPVPPTALRLSASMPTPPTIVQ